MKKIPKQILSRCEWGLDDYSLNVENLPQRPPEPAPVAVKRAPQAQPQSNLPLFAANEGSDQQGTVTLILLPDASLCVRRNANR